MSDATMPNLLMLVVSREQAVATRVEAHLRNLGWQVRAAWAQDREDAEEILLNAEPELVLCDIGRDLDTIADLARQLSPELPVLALETEDSAAPHGEQLKRIFEQGAVDLVRLESEADRAHLAAACRREFDASRTGWALRQAKMRLAEYEARQRTLVAETSRAMLTLSEGIVIEANPAAAELLGFDDSEGLVAQPLLDLIHADDRSHVRELVTQLTRGRIAEAEFTAAFHSGAGDIALHVRMASRDSSGEEEMLLDAVLRPEAAPKKDNAAAASQADLKPAQNFADIRRGLAAAVDAALSQQSTLGVLYICIDGFAAHEQRLGIVNAGELSDTWDALLANTLPAQSQLFRMRPDEVCALVPAKDADALEEIARDLCQQIARQSFRTDQYDCHLTNSVACYPLAQSSARVIDILRDSSLEARRLADEQGNAVSSIGDAARAAAEERQSREAAEDIKRALSEKNRFFLAYQAVTCLGEDNRQIYDVFVRMRDSSGTELHARDFLPTAERFGLMPTIDEWVIRRALHTLSKRQGLCLMVRLSEATLIEPSSLIQLLEAAQLAHPGLLSLQIRETVLQTQIRKAAALREKLRSLKVDLVLDYFGDSKSAVSLLEQMQPDYVKVSPTFANQIGEQAVHDRLASLIKASHTQGAKVIIPFVENTRIMGQLWQMGIDYVQGNALQQAETVMLASEAPARG
ncbi:EAL domain-containing response regulator [Algiphilus sp.]|uniref:EAL domain-containing response regulator n=1 Tax=Algiphilus sp. TaxID=1872431 RepID=UPI003B516665